MNRHNVSQHRWTCSCAVCTYPYWNWGEYLGSCGELSLCNVFRGWWYYIQDLAHTRTGSSQQYAYARQDLGNDAGLEQMVEDGLIEAFASIVVELTPREDEDQVIEEVGPQHEWPDTDDGF